MRRHVAKSRHGSPRGTETVDSATSNRRCGIGRSRPSRLVWSGGAGGAGGAGEIAGPRPVRRRLPFATIGQRRIRHAVGFLGGCPTSRLGRDIGWRRIADPSWRLRLESDAHLGMPCVEGSSECALELYRGRSAALRASAGLKAPFLRGDKRFGPLSREGMAAAPDVQSRK